MDNTNTVCVLPWNSIAIGSTGAGFPLMVCCNSNDGTIHANNGKVATTTDLPQLYDMTFTKNLKLDLFAGVKNSLCSRCWAMEPHSFRVGLNNAYPTAHSKILSTPPGEILQKLYESARLSLGQAAELAGLSKIAFAEIIGDYNVSLINHPISDILQDVSRI